MSALLKGGHLLATTVAAGAPTSASRLAWLDRMEKAERRFLIAFTVGIVAGIVTLMAYLWTLPNLAAFLMLPLRDLILIVLGGLLVIANLLAIFSYFTIGLVISRAVEIRSRGEED